MIEGLDPLFHDRARFGIMVVLLKNGEVDFNTLKRELGLTDGNLATHLRKLEEAGVVRYRKTFVGRRPRTYYSITEEGRERFISYLDKLKGILENLEKGEER